MKMHLIYIWNCGSCLIFVQWSLNVVAVLFDRCDAAADTVVEETEAATRTYERGLRCREAVD